MSSIKQKDVASGTFTLTLNALASSSTLIAGQQSTAVSNASNEYLDYLVSGFIKAGTSPTAGKSIEVWIYGSLNSTPDYPDGLTGTDGAQTFTSRDTLTTSCFLLASVTVTAVTGAVWYFRPTGIAQFFGGTLPTSFGLFVTQDTTVNLDAVAGGTFYYSGRYATVA